MPTDEGVKQGHGEVTVECSSVDEINRRPGPYSPGITPSRPIRLCRPQAGGLESPTYL
jgi:hypothetical protein